MKWEKKKRKKKHKNIRSIFGAQEIGGKKIQKKNPLHLTKFDEDKRKKHKRICKEHNNTPSLKKECQKHACIHK
jgi:hypothetical protein